MFVKDAISKVVSLENLTEDEARRAMSELIDGSATPSQIASLLTALRIKGETVEEIAAFARVMRENALKITPKTQGRLTDTCGTGGDVLKTFNISTISALVVAGAGVPVAKHGNRSVTSRCGSADLLESLGVNISAGPEVVQRSIEVGGIGFLFAQVFHSATKNVGLPRREIGIRTIFNVLGPLTNPAGAKTQLIGVYDASLVLKLAKVLEKLGTEDAIVVHGLGGLDEISLTGKTLAARLRNGVIDEEELSPASFGLQPAEFVDLAAPENLNEYVLTAMKILLGSMRGRDRVVRDMVLANASAALVASGHDSTYVEGMETAAHSVDSGKALNKLRELIKLSGGDLAKFEKFSSPSLEGRTQ